MLVSYEEGSSFKMCCPISLFCAILVAILLLGNRKKNPWSCGSSLGKREMVQQAVKCSSLFGSEESFLPESGWGTLLQHKSPVWWILYTLEMSKGASHKRGIVQRTQMRAGCLLEPPLSWQSEWGDPTDAGHMVCSWPSQHRQFLRLLTAGDGHARKSRGVSLGALTAPEMFLRIEFKSF